MSYQPKRIPPMPLYVIEVQRNYALMMEATRNAIWGAALAPDLALLLAFIGPSQVTATEAKRLGFFIGTNMSYGIRQLQDRGLIRKARGTDRRKWKIGLTAQGLEVAQRVRAALQAAEQRMVRLDEETAPSEDPTGLVAGAEAG